MKTNPHNHKWQPSRPHDEHWATWLTYSLIYYKTSLYIAGGNQRTHRAQKNFMVFQAGHRPAWGKAGMRAGNTGSSARKLFLKRNNASRATCS
ncbi:Chromodomain Y-Like Protein [Manis pentadactyla]|nr:Chromodomain Y-Like Protein [Manis pentadactyla]